MEGCCHVAWGTVICLGSTKARKTRAKAFAYESGITEKISENRKIAVSQSPIHNLHKKANMQENHRL